MAERFRDRARSRLEAEILSAAEDRLVSRGCLAFSLEEVAVQVGVAKGTVYLHFDSRQVLIRRALDHASERCTNLMRGILGSIGVMPALIEYAKANARRVNELAATTGRRELAYPCCLHHLHCPFSESDGLVPAIAIALERARADGQLTGGWWDSATLARWVRALLGDALTRASSGGDVEEIEKDIDMAVRLLREAIEASRRAT